MPTSSRRGDVIVVEVVYSDGSGAKRRPAVVVSDARFHRKLPDLIAAPITSQPRHVEKPGPGDVPIANWRRAGLRHPSAVRAGKIVAVDKAIIRKKIGRLPVDTMKGIERILRTALDLG